MNLFKTSVLSGLETAIKLASGFIVIKYVAIKTGPQGVAFFGQFQNFLSSCVILIAGGFTTGLVRFAAEEHAGGLSAPPNKIINSKKSELHKKEQTITKNYMGNALGLGLILSIALSIIISIFAAQLSMLILNSYEFTYIFYLLSLCTILIMIYQVMISVLNGWGELPKLILCKSLTSSLLLLLSLIFTYLYGIFGGLVALVGMQSLSAVFAVVIISRVTYFKWAWLKPMFNFQIYKKFFPYWLMSFVTIISTPLILMLIRSYVADHSNWETVGLWEASWKISEVYLLIITTALMTYYVPKLSRSSNFKEEQLLVKEVLLWGVIAASFLAICVYLFRYWIISLLFSPSFFAVSDILCFQLLGSVIKIAAWVFSYHMIVKGKTGLFLLTELVFGTSFYLLSLMFFNHYGLLGLSYSFFINYGLYLIYSLIYFYRETHLRSA